MKATATIYNTTTVEQAKAAVSRFRAAKKGPEKGSALRAELKAKQALIRCPTCSARPGEKCELTTGQLRTEPHRDRRWIAAD